jgi:hypothetical protein
MRFPPFADHSYLIILFFLPEVNREKKKDAGFLRFPGKRGKPAGREEIQSCAAHCHSEWRIRFRMETKAAPFGSHQNPLCTGRVFERRSLSVLLPYAGGVKGSLRFVILSEAKNPRLYGNKGCAFVIYYMSCADGAPEGPSHGRPVCGANQALRRRSLGPMA